MIGLTGIEHYKNLMKLQIRLRKMINWLGNLQN